MKGEYVEPHHPPKHENVTPMNMFSKLHPHHHHHHHLPFTQHFQLSRESEDDDTRSTGAAAVTTPCPNTTPTTTTPTQKQKPTEPNCSAGTDGATIEVVRRPRGRPPGSKNKPRPPVIIARDAEPAMSPYILEVPGGSDVVEAISSFCRRKNIGICVLSGSGAVANVTLRQPSTPPGSTITFHGSFDILSISATFLPQAVSYPVPNTFTISLAGPQGQIVDEGRNSGSGGGGEGHSPSVSGAGGGGGDSGHTQGGGESCGMAMYSSHSPSDVIWAPTARPPLPPPPF
ncbi:hypothetical protein GH714_026342 [Hevea brasiliensis]|uniref:PPC domain-containing protein n=1 Tax=Hevea brasiliensis TaxID=3981 RepID=A0A6A6LDS8_HEVBR|nr:hypothetical protein GH714_026342 [Hevea brasiliensis]